MDLIKMRNGNMTLAGVKWGIIQRAAQIQEGEVWS